MDIQTILVRFTEKSKSFIRMRTSVKTLKRQKAVIPKSAIRRKFIVGMQRLRYVLARWTETVLWTGLGL